MPLSATDKALARLFMAATFHHWDILPGEDIYNNHLDIPLPNESIVTLKDAFVAELGRKCYAEGASLEEIRSCVRHLIV